ncbi:MAG: glycosyltransferase family 25 protein [Hyphomicrobium sp.]
MLAFLINLDRDKDRLLRMQGETARVGLSFERFAAVDGDRVPEPLYAQFFAGGDYHERALTRGEVGCYASHLAVLEKFLSDHHDDCALVLEDDVRLADDLVGVCNAARARLGRWDIVRLSNTPKAVVLPLADVGGGVRDRPLLDGAEWDGRLPDQSGGRGQVPQCLQEAHIADR